jgi:hypothetical protein
MIHTWPSRRTLENRPRLANVAAGHALLWTLVLLPALFTALLVFRYGVDVPFWDEIAIAGLLEALDRGTLTIGGLFGQHNEHRMLVPRVLQLAVARSVGWDTRVLMWLTQGVLLMMMGGCIVLWRRSVSSRAPWALVSLALVSFVLFSPAQHQNLFWGFQICFYIPPACLLTSVILTWARKTMLGPALAAAAALSATATFSLFPGLLAWPLAAGAVLLRYGLPSRSTMGKWGLWATCAVGTIGLHFFRYEAPIQSPSVLAALRQPFTLLSGVAVCVGNPLSFGPRPVASALVTGTAVIGTFMWLLLSLWFRRNDVELVKRAGPWMILGGFGLLTAAAIAAGRVGYGLPALLEPRYASLTGWVLIGVIMLAASLRDRHPTAGAARGWMTISSAIALLYAVSFPHHLAAIQLKHRERLQSQAVYMFAYAAPTGWPMVPPWLDWPSIRQQLGHVETEGWRRRRPTAPIWIESGPPGHQCDSGAVEFATTIGSRLMAGGWAVLPTSHRAADAVMLTTGAPRQIVALQPPLIGRGDIGERFQTGDALVSGWVIDIRLAAGGEPLEFWALDAATLQAHRLCGADQDRQRHDHARRVYWRPTF